MMNPNIFLESINPSHVEGFHYKSRNIILVSLPVMPDHITKTMLVKWRIPGVAPAVFCNGGGFLSVKDVFSETGVPQHFTDENKASRK